MQGQLQKAIKLAKKTGDRLIVFDSAHTEEVYVVMSLDEYEKLVIGKSEVRGLTEEELLDKINRDIAVWKSEQNLLEVGGKDDFDYFADKSPDRNMPDQYDAPKRGRVKEKPHEPGGDYGRRESAGPRIHADPPRHEQMKKKSNPWAIPSARKEAAEEIIEEDRQYLEEVN